MLQVQPGSETQSQSPQPPAQQPAPIQQDDAGQAGPNMHTGQVPKPPAAILLPIIIAVVVVAALGGAYVYLSPHHSAITTTTVITTTIQQSHINRITRCTAISSPGNYYLTGNLLVSTISSCIVVNSSNVNIIGDNSTIHGEGPYTDLPPFTYGISVLSASNVSISGINVRNFSYGVYLSGVSNSLLLGVNASYNEVSDIMLSNSNNNTISHSNLFASLGKYGGIAFINSTGNSVLNSTSIDNARYGAVINSTGERFSSDTFSNNPTDIYCPSNEYTGSSSFSGVSCSTSLYCSFARCSSNNIPPQVSAIQLSNQISTCGSISQPGNYMLSSDINLGSLINVSTESDLQPCITISAPYVNLDCNGHSIRNAEYGIYVLGIYDNITDCTLTNNTDGIMSADNFNLNIRNTRIAGGPSLSISGVLFKGVSTGIISNVSVSNYASGIDILDSQGILFNRINASGNTNGVYVQNSTANIYQNSKFRSNSQYDLYCDVNSYNSSSNVFQGVQCGSTDCQWGSSCTEPLPPPLSRRPINSCTPIKYSGEYYITGNLISTGTCIDVQASNVSLNCSDYIIHGYAGSAIYVANQSNVTISDCIVTNQYTGINVTGSRGVYLSRLNLTGNMEGIHAVNDHSLTVLNVTVRRFIGAAGIDLQSVSNSSVLNSTSSSGVTSGSGFIISDSHNNTLKSDNAYQNPGSGFLINNSMDNVIENNSAFSNQVDFACSQSSSGIYSEQGGINKGVTKSGCHWLAEVNPIAGGTVCSAISTSSTMALTTDFVYGSGASCLTVYSAASRSTTGSNTTINCQGHTIISTNGGTFLDIGNVTGVVLENCYIKGFAYGVKASGYYQQIENNTIADSGYGIYLNGSQYSDVSRNRVSNSTYSAISVNGFYYGTISYNNVSTSPTGISLQQSRSDKVTGNIGTADSVGISLGSVQLSQFKGNLLGVTNTAGISCDMFSGAANSQNQDLGGNICTSNTGCTWMSQSPSCNP